MTLIIGRILLSVVDLLKAIMPGTKPIVPINIKKNDKLLETSSQDGYQSTSPTRKPKVSHNRSKSKFTILFIIMIRYLISEPTVQ